MPTVTASELLIPIGAALFIIFSPTQSQPSFPQNCKPGPVGEVSSWWTQLLQMLKAPLSPGFTGMHSTALFCYLGGKDISAIPLCKSRMEASRALICWCSCPDWTSSISGWFLHTIWAVIAVFLFHSISHAVAHRQAEPIHQNNTGEILFWC